MSESVWERQFNEAIYAVFEMEVERDELRALLREVLSSTDDFDWFVSNQKSWKETATRIKEALG